MLEPPEPIYELVEWLSALRLSQYTSCFQLGGYRTLEDCRFLTDERLLELHVFPTGHRRRILCSLEALGLKSGDGDEEREGEEVNGIRGQKPVPFPRYVFSKDKKRGTSCQLHQSKERKECHFEGSRTLPPGAGMGIETEDIPASGYLRPPQPAPRNPQNIQTNISEHPCYIPPSVSSSSSSSESLSVSEMPSDWETSSEYPSLLSADAVPCPAEDVGGFHGEMVENSIYEVQPPSLGPRLSRSYRLRHRPVPEIPNLTIPLLQDR